MYDVTEEELSWVEAVNKSYLLKSLENDITWAAYQSSSIDSIVLPRALTALMPLFREHANTPAMIHHAMLLIKKHTNFLNPGQLPIMTVDQPLYAIAKEIQWSNNQFSEDSFLVLMGDLHIEMTFMKCLGDLLDGSGWTHLISSSGILQAGKANAMLYASSNITLCRYIHQVTACSLYIMKVQAYKRYQATCPVSPVLSMDLWEMQQQIHPMSMFWNLILQLEFLLLEFVKSLRVGNFNLYINTVKLIAPWMFSLDHHNYARWLTVHLINLCELHITHPDVYNEFNAGKFVAQTSRRKFSKIALDHNHKQLNAHFKGVGGAVGLTENESALQRWLISGPEIARLISEFECLHCQDEKINEHHDSSTSSQRQFLDDIIKMLNTFEEWGNPFDDDSNDLYSLESKLVVPEDLAKNVRNMKQVGLDQFNEFINERLHKRNIPISDTIKKNHLNIFSLPKQTSSRKDDQLRTAKANVALFSRLFIACQTREGDLDQFFSHENQSCPPSLSEKGGLRPAKNKSDIVNLLLPSDYVSPCECPPVESRIFDGPALVNMLKPSVECRTFKDYAKYVLLPYLMSRGKHVKRLDLIWDRYFEKGLKS